MVAKYKMMCHSLLLGGVLSLVLIPAFAQVTVPGGNVPSEEEGTAGKEEMHKEMHKKMFQKLDNNGDGRIGEDEFEEVMEKKFERMDKDDDDHITQEEWQSAAEKHMEHKKEHMKEHMKEHHRGAPEGSEGHQREGM
ncbi:EF-hand domain-containing protein [Nitrosococcus wardiae]|uniref:EF-hand domain-containing protein n=1 Tax=Nitrosococcus wardiae TaxID=1814290 RepID=A0A4P7BZ32_9GAMM|nr:EF-hand domain-containing protein [Nitrosococcus wardiae]QBQ55341.1 EF-hand domain-containing protein [Nitrosococcus wardiae]